MIEDREEAFAAFVESEKLAKARRRRDLAERAEVLFELVQAPDDEPAGVGYKTELAAVSSTLRSNAIPFSQVSMAFDSADGMGFMLPEYVVLIKNLGPAAIGGIATAFAAWVHARNGRKVRLKIGDFEGEAYSNEQIREQMEMAIEYQARLKAGEANQKPGGKAEA